jgi:hypothetical protein
MNSPVQTGDSRALLRERLEALVSQLAELEKLREWVNREESRQRELREASRSHSRAPTVRGHCSFAEAKLAPALRGLDRSGCCNERRKANE